MHGNAAVAAKFAVSCANGGLAVQAAVLYSVAHWGVAAPLHARATVRPAEQRAQRACFAGAPVNRLGLVGHGRRSLWPGETDDPPPPFQGPARSGSSLAHISARGIYQNVEQAFLISTGAVALAQSVTRRNCSRSSSPPAIANRCRSFSACSPRRSSTTREQARSAPGSARSSRRQ